MDPDLSTPLSLDNSSMSEVKLEVLDRPTVGMLTVFFLASIIGFIGNCIILAVIIGSKKFRIKSNYLIGNLSAASLFFIALGAFAFVYRTILLTFTYGLRACQLYVLFLRLPVAIFSFTTIGICSDRNHIVVNPLRRPRSTCVILCQILSIWGCSVVLMLPIGLAGSLEETVSSADEHPTRALHCIESWTNASARMIYSIFLFVLIHLLPILIMIRGMLKIRSKMRFLLRSQNLFSQGSDRRVRLMRNNCIFFSIFIICWLPTGIFRIPMDLPRNHLPHQLVVDLLYYNDLCATTGYVITCIIPIILFTLSHDLRDHLGTLKCLSVHEPEIQQLSLANPDPCHST